jgi:hypothetical protein
MRCRKNAVIVFRGGAGKRFYSQGKPNTVDPGADFIIEHVDCACDGWMHALVFVREDDVPPDCNEVINIVGDVIGDIERVP